MQKRSFIFLLCAAACWLCLVGCASAPKTVLLNTVEKFFSNETMLEATARELTLDGSDASVRLHIVNLSGEPIDGFGVTVNFLDEAGNVLYTDAKRIQFEVALESYEGTSITADCSGKNVKQITGVSVSGD